MGLLETVTGTLSEVKQYVTDNKSSVLTGIGVAAAGTALGVGAVALSKSRSGKRKSKKKRKKISHSKRGWKQDRKRKSRQPWEIAYRRRKRRKHHNKRSRGGKRGRVHHTKNGQPYIILKSGKARFIKKRR